MARNCCKYFTVSLVPVASVVLAVLFGLAIAVLPVLYIQLAKQYRYGVIVDAGSSHTDMFFYRWEVPRYRDTARHFQQEHHCYSDESLNSYADRNTSEAGSVLQSCITKSRNRDFVTSGQRSNTQLFLGATAGMRLVYCKNVTLGEEIMSSVNSTLGDSGYHLVSGRVISGQEEAVAGWITGNYLKQHLKHSGGSSLAGSLDLGGASAEIAFLDSTSDPRSHTPYHTNVSLYDRNYALYARSYLCYGLNEAYRRFLAHLINGSSDVSQPIPNPCLLAGTNLTYQRDDVYSECVSHNCSSGVFGFGFSPPSSSSHLSPEDDDEPSNYTFNGTGDPEECRDTILQVFDLANCTQWGACLHDHYMWPPINNSGTFLGMSGFYSVASFFNQSDRELQSLTNFSESVQDFCLLGNSSATARWPSDPYLQRLCFDGVFSLFLLQTGFGFNKTNSDWTLTFRDKVNHKTSVGWAMGYLLQETTTIPDSPHHTVRPFEAVDLAVGILVLAILCVVFVVFFFLTFHACRKVLRTSSGYTNIS